MCLRTSNNPSPSSGEAVVRWDEIIERVAGYRDCIDNSLGCAVIDRNPLTMRIE